MEILEIWILWTLKLAYLFTIHTHPKCVYKSFFKLFISGICYGDKRLALMQKLSLLSSLFSWLQLTAVNKAQKYEMEKPGNTRHIHLNYILF